MFPDPRSRGTHTLWDPGARRNGLDYDVVLDDLAAGEALDVLVGSALDELAADLDDEARP